MLTRSVVQIRNVTDVPCETCSGMEAFSSPMMVHSSFLFKTCQSGCSSTFCGDCCLILSAVPKSSRGTFLPLSVLFPVWIRIQTRPMTVKESIPRSYKIPFIITESTCHDPGTVVKGSIEEKKGGNSKGGGFNLLYYDRLTAKHLFQLKFSYRLNVV